MKNYNFLKIVTKETVESLERFDNCAAQSNCPVQFPLSVTDQSRLHGETFKKTIKTFKIYNFVKIVTKASMESRERFGN